MPPDAPGEPGGPIGPENPLPPKGLRGLRLPDWVIKYRYVIVAIVALVIISPFFIRWSVTYRTIAANPVVQGPNGLKGSFTISTADEDGIPSRGTGGACLVADLNRFGIPPMVGNAARTCVANWQCALQPNPQQTPQHTAQQSGWGSYCHVEQGKETGTCWVRPGPGKPAYLPGGAPTQQLCNRSIDYSPLQIWGNGTEPSNLVEFPVGLPAGILPAGQTLAPDQRYLDWRVVACLNRLDPDTGRDNSDCGLPNSSLRREVFGNVAHVTWP